MITTKSLSKNFGEFTAVDNVNLKIESGEVVGLIGKNGAGKTTTIRLLSTIYRPTQGGAIVAGHDIITEPLEVRAKIGLSFEKPSLYPRLTASRNLKYYADLYDVKQSEDRIDSLLKLFDLYDVKDRKVKTYSKGMTQKLSIIKSLIHDPELLIFDEPWSGLSPDAIHDLRNYILELKKQGKTILISTHNLLQAEMLIDRLLIINNGSIIKDTTPSILREEYNVNPIVSMKLNGNITGIEKELDYISKVETKDSTVNFHISNYDFTPDLIKNLIQKDVKIFSVQEVIPSLEEIYLKILKEANQ